VDTPEDLRYSKDHEWCRREGDQAVVGVTDHAQRRLGDVVFVELPKASDRFDVGEPCGSIESVKAVSEVYSPVAGTVRDVNTALGDSPELINEDPYGDGWIVRITMSDPSGYDTLLSAAQYQDYCRQEAE
jgi:glycine cleavage system H protein